ncbi:MAG: lysylphosphatidylglycerol synthase transmembrane domain-containing protein [Nitrososphaerota archaeon]
MFKEFYKIFIPLIIGIILIFILIFYIGIDKIVYTVLKLNIFYILLGGIFTILFFIFRAFRWILLIKPMNGIKISMALSATGLGYLINTLIPLRIGEIARALAISKESKKSFASIFATVIIERIFDLIYLLLFLSILLFFIPFSISSNIIIIASFELAGVVIFIGLIFIFSIIKFEEKFINFINKILKPFPKKIKEALINFSISLIEGSKTLKIVYKNIFFHIFSFFITFFQALIFIMIIYSLDIKISLFSALIISLIITLSHALPAAPGYVGSFQIVWIAIFSLIGLPIETIISSSIIANFINLLYILFISGVLASLYGFKISEYLELTMKKKYY